jgi:hypothetical protein
MSVMWGDLNNRCGQLGWRIHEQGPLSKSEVRLSDRCESSGEPGLLTKPRHRIDAIVDLVDHGFESATGAERPTTPHQYDVIATSGIDATLPGHHRAGETIGAANQDRSAAGAKWRQMVSEQGYAVPGGNVNVPPDCVVSSCCVPSPQAAADDGVERSHPPGT